jgi:peptidase M42 family hydrolase
MALQIDEKYLIDILFKLLAIPSPSGYTDAIVRFVGAELEQLGVVCETTRRGAIRADLPGRISEPDRALVAHLDTIGAMVTRLKRNGRLALAPVGHWSSRFAEGARATVLTDTGSHRGTVLPLKASGHVYGDEIDVQPVAWSQLEVRVDEDTENLDDLANLGFRVGDYVAFDPAPEITDSGYINSRHLDNKAGVACLLASAKAIVDAGETLPIDCHLLFTIFEEVGSGASAVLHQDVAEMVSIDNAVPAPGQNSTEKDVTIAMMDSAGPFDYHLSHRLIELAETGGIPYRRDVFRHYRSDAASAVEAGNDIRTALVCFGVDGSHGNERTHIESLLNLCALVTAYMQSEAAVPRDRMPLGPLNGFPEQPQ